MPHNGRLLKPTSRLPYLIRTLYEWRVIRPGHWERAQISEMGIIGS